MPLKARKDLSREKLDLILKGTNVVLQLIEDLPCSDLISFSREKISLMENIRNESKTAQVSIKLASDSETIIQQTEDLFIQARDEFVRPLEASGLAVQDLQQFSRQMVKEYANKYFKQEFIDELGKNGIRLSDLSPHLREKLCSFDRSTSLPGLLQDVLQNVTRDIVEKAMSELQKDLVQSLIDYLPTDLTKDQMKTLLLVFVVVRGKAKEKIIDQEKVIYAKKDRDAYKGVEQNFDTEDPKESRGIGGFDVRTIESESRFFNEINVNKGTIIGYDNNQSPSHSYYRSDIVIYQIDLLIKKVGKTFGDFAITKTISNMLANLDTIRSVQLALPKNVGRLVFQVNEHTFDAGSDGWYAYKGSQTGYYPWFLSAQHQQALKGREPKRVLVKVGRNIYENEEDYLTLTTEFDEAWS